ncbi:e3 ubiquitin-protein ligase [Anaeramoeba ignava]|uniref:E3 ubiquitin-protein ligase n=1 Tax=Anaeramoeba ignava TaxID=1746090 RepID=A0A9Q0LHB8_ANAIG|nr:e3 ubiquitin-protein ligase [Anaeramoeba ignava]
MSLKSENEISEKKSNKFSTTKKLTKTEDLIENLRFSLQKSRLGQDLIIEANNQKLYVYSSILSTRSPALIRNIPRGHLQLEYNYEVVKTALEYIYTSKCNIPVVDPNQVEKTPFDLTCDLLSFAKEYALHQLEFYCKKFLLSEIERVHIHNETMTQYKTQSFSTIITSPQNILQDENSGIKENDSNPQLIIIKNAIVCQLESVNTLGEPVLLEKVFSIIDKQMEDIIQHRDYLNISDLNLKMILYRDTLNISSELQILQMVIDYAIQTMENENQNQNQNQNRIQNQNSKKGMITIIDQRTHTLLKTDFIKFVRFGALNLDEFSEVIHLDLLTPDEIIDISDFIENINDGNYEENQKIIEKYTKEKEVHWFKSKRVYSNSNTIIPFENEEISKRIHPKNVEKREGPIEKFANHLQNWIGEDIFKKMKLQFVSKKEDKLTCQHFHQICDNKAPILIIIESEGNIFGGYSSAGWKKPEKQKSSDFYNDIDIDNDIDDKYFEDISYIEDDKAFLFLLKATQKDQQLKIELKEKESKKAIVYYSQRGPIFGDGWDLAISADLKTGYSNPGHTYQLPNNIEFDSKESKMFFTRDYGEWKVNKLEVYF